jgi:mono/diheme cytochrome c family protein/YHS domain-containing protein
LAGAHEAAFRKNENGFANILNSAKISSLHSQAVFIQLSNNQPLTPPSACGIAFAFFVFETMYQATTSVIDAKLYLFIKSRRWIMFKFKSAGLMGMALVLAMSWGCKKRIEPIPVDLQRQIAAGESVFYRHDCGKCHQVDGYSNEHKGPDLTSVFLAMDTVFIKAHLQFTEISAMPQIPLTPHQISAVTQYIASLHAQKNTPANLLNPDTRCPVCGAEVESAGARTNSLEVSHKGKFYHFECPDCKAIFLRDPDWHSHSGYVRNYRN